MYLQDRSISAFPIWIELSGLPLHLNEEGKTPYAWAVFSKLLQLDMALNPRRPGLVEIPVGELAARCGVDATKIEKAVKAMRKVGIIRAFLPEEEVEPGLFQVITPLPTPLAPDNVRAHHPELFLECAWPPRYATAVVEEEEEVEGEPSSAKEKIKKVADLYLDVFSMKINPIILDQLQLISDRYDLSLIKSIFLQARDIEGRTLGWVLAEIRREEARRARIEARKREEAHNL